jgi:vancomycin resistance protein YoaR
MAVAGETRETREIPYTIYGRRRRPWLRHTAILGTGLAALLALGLGVNAWTTRDVIQPGVSVGGVDVGGMSKADARALLVREIGDRLGRPVQVRTQAGTVTVVPGSSGIGIDLDRALAEAYSSGRVEARLLPHLWSAEINPPLEIASTNFLPEALANLQAKPRDARLVVKADGTARVVDGVAGASFDTPSALRAIGLAGLAGRAAVDVPVQQLPPAISTEAAKAAMVRAEQLLAKSIPLRFSGKQVGRLTPKQLAPLLRAAPAGGDVALSIDPKGLAPLLKAIAKKVDRAPRNATFTANGKFAHIKADRPGLKLNAAITAENIVSAGTGVTQQARVGITRKEAAFTTEDAKKLGISVRLFKKPITTLMGGSSSNRIHNVHLLADMLDGRIIKAGQTFDFNKAIGQRTTARGFLVGQQIENGQLVPAIGGGVCQVVTTLYDAAFYAGLKIVARRNHDFYLSHYPLGMDATVSWGGPEFQFVNTLKHAILIKTSYTNSTMSIQFYGTREGITVTQKTGPKSNFTSPGVRKINDPTVPAGEEVRSGGGNGGFTVTVFRTVKRNGKVIRKDQFTSHYTPADVIIKVGPPKPKDKSKLKPPAATGTDGSPGGTDVPPTN